MPVLSPLAKLPQIDQHSDNLAEAVYDALMDAIIAGDLPPGSVLSALKLSGHLQVSRTPVQQALTLLAAGRMDERHLAPLRQTVASLKSAPLNKTWQENWTVFDEDFHRTIAECSGNPLLAKDIGRYHLLHRGVNRIAADVESLPSALEEHIEILNALENRDGAAARDAMDAHIARWQIIFTQRFPTSDG